MPRSKREKEVSFTKVKKKTRVTKTGLVDELRKCVESYATLYLFSVENMRSDLFIEARQHFKANSRFFFGKNNVMAVALGKTRENECQKNLHKIANALKGQCGLMFTNVPHEEVVKYFEEFRHTDYARGGLMATETVELEEGLLPQFAFSMEPQLRKLGLPTKLDKGQVALYKNFLVCTEGEQLNNEQAKILKVLGYKMSEFHIVLHKKWQRSTGKIEELDH
ncbi:unnamed protein product, partial [Mesorhabditis spiculigera]